MNNQLKKIFLSTLILLGFIGNSYGYDITGHRIVADIAYQNLNCKARHHVDKLLGKRGLIYDSSWADDLRNDTSYSDSYGWHYQNLPAGLTSQQLEDNWNNPKFDGEHLFFAIQEMEKRLKANKNDSDALKFLIHFIGDLHQPFHLGHAEDRGGNDIHTNWMGRDIRVHSLWDSQLIAFQGYSYTEYTQFLMDKFAPEKKAIKKETLTQSIDKVYALSQELYKYDYTKMNMYGYSYQYRDELNLMLYSAGIQLAKILNKMY